MNRFVVRSIVLLTIVLALPVFLPDYTAAMRAQLDNANAIAAPVPALNQGRSAPTAEPLTAEATSPLTPSQEAQTALAFITQREQLPIDTLVVVNEAPFQTVSEKSNRQDAKAAKKHNFLAVLASWRLKIFFSCRAAR